MDSTRSSLHCSSSSASHPPLPLLPPSPQIKYDVFLSFRGEDTRYNITSHLHKALDERGINTFIDYNLNRGDDISPALLTAIEESRVSIIIFSKNYASSRWCLEELMKILECKNRETNQQIVIPIFYGVTPSDLRNQTGSLADAFAKHEKCFKQNLKQVRRWKDALKEAANLSGWPSSSDKSEAELIEVIVEDVWQKLNCLSSSDASNLVGIDSKIKEIETLLCMGTNDIHSVGIWGIGGIGKTTLAEAVFNKISRQFKGSSYFARNVRERCEQSDGLNHLQRELLSALLRDKHININVYDTGRTFIKNMLRHKKLLIAFDDVSNFRQIKMLIGGFDCLGFESRIIITTRDKQVLKNCGVNEVYEVQELNEFEALELFRMHAFKKNHPTEDYMKLSERVVKYAGGVPLALEVLGSYLYEKNIEVWESAIKKMGRELNMDIYEVLKISYDGLGNEVKKIFLDIACFFKWSSIEHVKSALEACGFQANDGIQVLLDRSLIVISNGTITMHDLLEEMAKEIERRKSEDPENRSRLWNYEEIYDVLTKSKATEKIEGIALDMSKIRDNILLNSCDFGKNSKLRILKFYNSSFEELNRVHVSQGNFPALRYLSWHRCPINSPLSSLSLENLVILNMSDSKVEQLWNGVMPLAKLKEVDLSYSYLTNCPDFSGSPNLKKLDLLDCKYLHEISPSIGRLNELHFLCLSGCTSLKTIPDLSGLISLRDLRINGCINLEMLHEMPPNLETFSLCFGVLEELPLSFGNLNRLQTLCFHCCKRLQRLPSTVRKLKSLRTLFLCRCLKPDELPDDRGCLNSLEYVSVDETPITELPSSIIHLKKLGWLDFSGLQVYDYASMADDRDDNMADNSDENEYLDDDLNAVEVNFELRNYTIVKRLPKLQLGGRRVDNLPTVEVLSSLSFEDCTVKNALKVPEWFNFRSTRYFINPSPQWLKKNFMGFALWVAVAPPQYSQDHFELVVICWTCKVISKDGQSFIRRGQFTVPSKYVSVEYPILPFSSHILCDAKEVSFEIKSGDFNGKNFEIEMCGVHLMYGRYIEEVGESSRVSEDENNLSLAIIHDICEEVDELHHERLKKTLN